MLVRAAKPGQGPARETLKLIRSGSHVLVTSDFLLLKLVRVLNYPRVRAQHQMSQARIQQFARDYYEAGEVVQIELGVGQVISSDPDDDSVIETAVAGKADVICTLGQHFRKLAVAAYCSNHGIRVLNDVELLEELRKEKSARRRNR